MDIYDARGTKVGYVNNDGDIYDVHGRELGKITRNGWVYVREIPVGIALSEGHIYALTGKKVGEISKKGTVQDENGTPMGKVDATGDFILASGGGALLFLLTAENNYQLPDNYPKP